MGQIQTADGVIATDQLGQFRKKAYIQIADIGSGYVQKLDSGVVFDISISQLAIVPEVQSFQLGIVRYIQCF